VPSGPGLDFPGETFRVLKEREIKQYGEYRTRRLVLEAWDRLGLAPRNRDGRYAVESAGSPRHARRVGNETSRVGRSPERGKAKRAVVETKVKWPSRQASFSERVLKMMLQVVQVGESPAITLPAAIPMSATSERELAPPSPVRQRLRSKRLVSLSE
jgi:hypothetical protein